MSNQTYDQYNTLVFLIYLCNKVNKTIELYKNKRAIFVIKMTRDKVDELLACRVCLAVDVDLYEIRECRLEQNFTDLMGIVVSQWDGCPRHICVWCRAQMLKYSVLRRQCQRSQGILQKALAESRVVTVDYLRTIDRVAQKLSLNLKTCSVYTSDSTQPEFIKIEDTIKEETNDFIENIFINEPDFDDSDVINNEINETNGSINTYTLEEVVVDLKRTRLAKTSKKRKKCDKQIDKSKNPKIVEANTKTKRIIKRRMADNGFLPDFNFDEFQTKYNVRIDILSKEEQLREVEGRKMAASYTLAAFGCEVCGKGFATKAVYDGHMAKHSVSAGAHACEICLVRFKTRSRAHVHQDTHRLKFTCEACGFVTRTRFIAKNHFLSHAGTTHKCPHCDAVFSKYTSYLTHVRRRHPAANTACEMCGETFVGDNGLRHHKTRTHRNSELSVPQFECKCVVCGAHFTSVAAMETHAAAATDGCDDSMRPCPHCGEECRSDEGLGRHQREHHAQRALLCRECNKWFSDAQSWGTHRARAHLNQRLKEPPRARPRPAHAFVCETCGSECTSLTNLAAHQRRHSGARPHACPAPGCPLCFSSLHNMRRHHRVVHLGQRPQVKCGTCGKLLAHAASLKLHVNTVHLKLPLPPRQRRRDK
ncbi:uncharacterized protein [Choristoneura fumiferana]|uniref:uncharacterized protein n=1 Tax=Choristoneura fumiferana TaxID=7141 RepID=UPI003D15B035